MQTVFESTLPVNELILQMKRDGVYSENFTGQELPVWYMWFHNTDHKMQIVPEAFVFVRLKL